MRSSLPHSTVGSSRMYKFGVFMFICILVLNGTYIRGRSSDPDVDPTLDWLILIRLLTCAIAFILGIILVPKNMSWGLGGKFLLFYTVAAGLSVIKSPYPMIAIGHFIQLVGISFLVIGLVYHAKDICQLQKIEKIWFMVVSVLIVKDTITSLLFPMEKMGVVRLGMGITHAILLSTLAALVFWMSFKQNRTGKRLILWLLRAFLIYVMIYAISRTSIVAFVIGGFFYYLLNARDYLKRSAIIFDCISVVVVLFALALSFEHKAAWATVDYLRRGQDDKQLSTFTGRAYIWPHVFRKSFESPIVGKGYCTSRLTMGDIPEANFRPFHCHNEILEAFLNTGIMGLIPFIGMLIYSLGWIKNSSKLQKTFSKDLAIHAACVVAILLTSSMFASRLTGKLSPVQPLFFFYLLVLDRKQYML